MGERRAGGASGVTRLTVLVTVSAARTGVRVLRTSGVTLR
jgi:hypothetical protein